MHGFLSVIPTGNGIDIAADRRHNHQTINAESDQVQQNILDQSLVCIKLCYRFCWIKAFHFAPAINAYHSIIINLASAFRTVLHNKTPLYVFYIHVMHFHFCITYRYLLQYLRIIKCKLSDRFRLFFCPACG